MNLSQAVLVTCLQKRRSIWQMLPQRLKKFREWSVTRLQTKRKRERKKTNKTNKKKQQQQIRYKLYIRESIKKKLNFPSLFNENAKKSTKTQSQGSYRLLGLKCNHFSNTLTETFSSGSLPEMENPNNLYWGPCFITTWLGDLSFTLFFLFQNWSILCQFISPTLTKHILPADTLCFARCLSFILVLWCDI